MQANMAAHSSKRNRVPYDFLNNLSSADILWDARKKRKVKTIGVYQAERVVACQREKGVKHEKRYLVKWKGYSSFENTWEPEEHLSPASLRYFNQPNPSQEIVQPCLDRMRRQVLESLKHKYLEQRISFEFRHDVFDFLFKGLGTKQNQWFLLDEVDFRKCKFPKNWGCFYNKDGDGFRMKYPVKIRKFLSKTQPNFEQKGQSIVKVSSSYEEKITMNFIKITSTCRNPLNCN